MLNQMPGEKLLILVNKRITIQHIINKIINFVILFGSMALRGDIKLL